MDHCFYYYVVGGWFNLNINLKLLGTGNWCWNDNTSDCLTYQDGWMATPNGDGICGNFYVWDNKFGFNDHDCGDEIGYICEDIHCYLLP